MKKKYTVLLFITLFSVFQVFSENKVTFKTDGNKLSATITLNSGEAVYLNSNTLYLIVEAQDYSFIFNGYPDGIVDSDGEIFYSDKVTLTGELIVNQEIEPSEATINAIVGFQVINSDGEAGIPMEVAQDLLIKTNNGNSLVSYILFVLMGFFIILFIVLLVLYLKRRNFE